MRHLVLVGVLAGSASAEDYVSSVHLGLGRIDAGSYDNDAGGDEAAWALAAGADAGMVYEPFRFSIGFDYAAARTTLHPGYVLEPTPSQRVTEQFLAVSAKIELDYEDYILLWGGVGLAAQISKSTGIGYRYELGVGSRVWRAGPNALRVDLSFAHYELEHDSDFSVGHDQYALSVGFERYF